MADNKTHSYSTTKTSTKSTNDLHEMYHSISDFNTSATSTIPAYSQINSATISVAVTKNPTGSLKVGSMKFGYGTSASTQTMLYESGSTNFSGTESGSANILSHVSSKQSDSGYITPPPSDYECPYFRVSCYFTAAYSQQFTSTVTVTWNYNEPRVKVTVSKTGEGTVTGAGTYHYGNNYTITATPATGWKFVKWSDGNTNASRTFTANSSLITSYETSKSYQAIFEKTSHTISTAVSPTGGGTVTGGGNYEYGSTPTLIATPATGYKFVKWNDGNTDATRAITVTGAATYTAYFEVNTEIYRSTKKQIAYKSTKGVGKIAVYKGTKKIYG